jgi:hypothetical protein
MCESYRPFSLRFLEFAADAIVGAIREVNSYLLTRADHDFSILRQEATSGAQAASSPHFHPMSHGPRLVSLPVAASLFSTTFL